MLAWYYKGWTDDGIGRMYLERAQYYLEHADQMERNQRAWALNCAQVAAGGVKPHALRKLWRDVGVKRAKTYKPKTEAEAVAELKRKGLGPNVV